MTTARIVACQVRKCAHFMGAKGILEDPVFVCEAFPKGIPERILSGQDAHEKRVSGDGGIQYQRRGDV